MPKGDYSNSVLSHFFEPRSVAVIGSLGEGMFGGYVVVKSLLEAGYDGEIYPVNPKYEEVIGLKAYPSVKDVRGDVDLALIMINAQSVPRVMKECVQRGVRAAVVISDGFAERGREGVRLQDEIVQIARTGGIRIIGPNTAGIANSRNGFNPCPYEAGYYKLRKGPVTICSQTGMINPQAFPYPSLRFGVNKICDFGNKCDFDECDMLEYMEKDSTTEVISMYLESIKDGRRFLEISKMVAPRKPVLILKSGRTQAGARASVSHTGSLAVDDQVFNSACNQAGVLRLDRFAELFELPKIFVSQPLPRGNRLGIISYTGGVGVVSADEGSRYGLAVTNLSSQTAEMLNDIFPGFGKMPVDVGPVGAAVKDFIFSYAKVLNAVMADENVDCLVNVIWADSMGITNKIYVDAYEGIKGHYQKPVVTWIYGPSLSVIADLAEQLEDLGFPVFSDLEMSIKALGMAFRYSNIKKGDGLTLPDGKR